MRGSLSSETGTRLPNGVYLLFPGGRGSQHSLPALHLLSAFSTKRSSLPRGVCGGTPSPSLSPAPHPRLCGLDSSRGLPCVESRGTCPSVTGLLHSAPCPRGPSTLWQASGCPSFLGLSAVPLRGWTRRAHLLTRPRTPGLSPPLAAVRTWGWKRLLETLLSVIFGTHPEVGSLDPMVILFHF